jgi:hypothetical protein
MAFEQLRAEIEQLVQQMENEPEDIHELHARIRSKLNELKATGMPLPDDLVALERRLDREEMAQRADAGVERPRPARTVRSRPAKPARKPAKAAKKAARASAKKSKRPAAKAGRRGAKAKRSPARAARKASRSAKKAKRSARRRR